MDLDKPVTLELTRIEYATIECNKLEDLERELNIFLLPSSSFDKINFDFLGSNIDVEKVENDNNAKCQIRQELEFVGFAKTGKEILDVLYSVSIEKKTNKKTFQNDVILYK